MGRDNGESAPWSVLRSLTNVKFSSEIRKLTSKIGGAMLFPVSCYSAAKGVKLGTFSCANFEKRVSEARSRLKISPSGGCRSTCHRPSEMNVTSPMRAKGKSSLVSQGSTLKNNSNSLAYCLYGHVHACRNKSLYLIEILMQRTHTS